MCGCARHISLWRSEEDIVELVVSFCLYEGSRHWIQVPRLAEPSLSGPGDELKGGAPTNYVTSGPPPSHM